MATTCSTNQNKRDDMKCFSCDCPETRVLETRVNRFGWIRRRRVCPECEEKFKTYELPEWAVDMSQVYKEKTDE